MKGVQFWKPAARKGTEVNIAKMSIAKKTLLNMAIACGIVILGKIAIAIFF